MIELDTERAGVVCNGAKSQLYKCRSPKILVVGSD